MLATKQLTQTKLRIHLPGNRRLFLQVQALLAITALQRLEPAEVVIGGRGLQLGTEQQARQQQAGTGKPCRHCCSSCSLNRPSNSMLDR